MMTNDFNSGDDCQRRSPSDPDGEAVPSSDGSLLRRYRRGDDDAATALYMRYAHRLRAVAQTRAGAELKQRVDAEDLVQSIFRTFFRRAVEGQYEVPEGEELWRLLLVIALNKVRNLGIHHRAAKRSIGRTTSGEAADVGLALAASADETPLIILKMAIDELLAPLPADYRSIVELRISGFEVSEIAEQSGRSKRSVERILQEFRQKLGQRIHG